MMILGFTICLILHFSFKKKTGTKKKSEIRQNVVFVVWQFLIPFLRRRKKTCPCISKNEYIFRVVFSLLSIFFSSRFFSQFFFSPNFLAAKMTLWKT